MACDVATSSFCYVSEDAFPESPIFLARVVEAGSDWRDIQILEVLRGEEERETVRIWDGPTAWCNGPFFAPASAYGSVGDSIICIANLKVETDTFSVPLNDYYHTPVLEAIVSMKIQNGLINTLIFESSTSIQMPYVEFLNADNNWSQCMGSAQAVEEVEEEEILIFPNPASDFIEIENGQKAIRSTVIYSSSGDVLEVILGQHNSVDISDMPNGLLLIKVEQINGAFIFKRLIHH